jgi:holin-like protein
MKYLKQFALIATIVLAAEFIKTATNLFIPSNVLGLLILWLLLNLKIVKEDMLKETSDFLLANLAILFVPLGVSLLDSFQLIRDNWWQILLILISSTIVVMLTTAATVQLLSKKSEQNS